MENKMMSINNFGNMYRHASGLNNPQVAYAIKPKLHGSNGSVRVNLKTGVFEVRSKNRVLTESNDHLEFCKKMNLIRDVWEDCAQEYEGEVTFFGEWAGNGVQRSQDAICMLNTKMFFPFAVLDEKEFCYDFLTTLSLKESGLVRNLPVLEYMNIPMCISDDINPAVEKINKHVESFEEVDPYVEKEFGIRGPGEGVVGGPITAPTMEEWFAYAFKAKTEAHRVKKTKMAASGREPLPQEALQFAEMFVTMPRLNQAIAELGVDLDMKNTPLVLQWMGHDIKKESVNELEEMGLEWKSVAKIVNTRVVQLWKSYCNSI